MPLAFNPIHIPFAGGLDTKTSPALVPVNELLELENAVFDKAGALVKRWGYEAKGTGILGSSTGITSLVGGSAFNGELIGFSGTKAYSFLDATNGWVDRGNATSLIASTTQVIRNTSRQRDPDIARIGNMTAIVWEESGVIKATIVDGTGARIMHDQTLSTGSTNENPRVVSFGNDFVFFWVSTQYLWYRRVNKFSPSTLQAAVNLTAGVHATDNTYDAYVIGKKLFVAWNNASSLPTMMWLDSGYASSSTTWTAGGGTTSASAAMSIFTDDQLAAWLVWGASSGGVRAIRLSHELESPTSVVTIDSIAPLRVSGIVPAGSLTAQIYYDNDADPSSIPSRYRVKKNTMTSTGTAGTAADMMRGAGLVARPFEYNSTVYLTVIHESTLQSTYFVVTGTGAVVARVSPTTAGDNRSVGSVSHVVGSGGVYTISHLEKGRLFTDGGTAFAQIGVAWTELDFTAKQRYASASVDQNLLVVGGVLQAYDGFSFTEHGFHLFPEGTTATPATTGGLLGAGTYFYKVMYEWIDAQGQLHRSAPSQAVEVITTTATSKVTLTIPTLRITSKSGVRIVVYRTKKDEEIFYRVTNTTSAILNNTGVDTVTYEDTAADTAIETNEILYTTGGILENIAPPSCSLICSYRGRAFIAGLPTANRLWFSKEVFPGDGIGFSDSLYLDFPSTGGPISAIGVMDDYLVIFKETAIFIVSGNGPNDAGEGIDYGAPRQLSAEVGCIEPGSVCNVPQGLLFKSNKGFYLIDKGLNVVYVGQGVHAYNSQLVTGSVLVPDRNVAVFVCQSGNALVYDHHLNRWGTFTNHEGASIDIWDNKVVLFRTDGKVYVQSNSRYDDAGVFVKMRVVTGWLAAAQLQGYQRINRCQLLGEYKGSHKLRVRFGFDYEPMYPQDIVVDAATILSGTTYGTDTPYGAGTPYGGKYPGYTFKINLARQKCQSLRVCIEDTPPSSGAYGDTMVLTGISFNVGVKPGFNRLPTTKAFGSDGSS